MNSGLAEKARSEPRRQRQRRPYLKLGDRRCRGKEESGNIVRRHVALRAYCEQAFPFSQHSGSGGEANRSPHFGRRKITHRVQNATDLHDFRGYQQHTEGDTKWNRLQDTTLGNPRPRDFAVIRPPCLTCKATPEMRWHVTTWINSSHTQAPLNSRRKKCISRLSGHTLYSIGNGMRVLLACAHLIIRDTFNPGRSSLSSSIFGKINVFKSWYSKSGALMSSLGESRKNSLSAIILGASVFSSYSSRSGWSLTSLDRSRGAGKRGGGQGVRGAGTTGGGRLKAEFSK